MLGDNGYPYAVPLSYVYKSGCLYFHSALNGHKIDVIRNYDKASFYIIDKDDVHANEYTTYFHSVILFGKIIIIDDEKENYEAARLLGNHYNPNNNEMLEKELKKGFSRMLIIRFDIEHMTGKQAIELFKEKNN